MKTIDKNDLCVFEYFKKPKKYPIEEFGRNGITKLFLSFSTKYLHPNLYLIAIDGIYEVGKTYPVIKLHLFPNRKMVECEQVAKVLVKRLYDSNIHLPPLFSSDFGPCPTLIIPSMPNTKSDDVKLYADFLKKFLDAKETLKMFKKYRRNRYMRIRLDFSYMVYGDNVNKNIYESISDDEAIELAKILLTKNKTELPAFFNYWEETANQFRMHHIPDIMDLEEFMKWFDLIFGVRVEE